MTPTRSEGKNWQQVLMSGTFAVLLLLAGWLYSSYNEQQKELAVQFDNFKQAQYLNGGTQDSRIAVLENETRNLKEILTRMEAANARIEAKLDQAIRK